MANRIRNIRESRAKIVPAAFTLTAVAKRVGVSDTAFRRWEQGVSRPTLRHTRRLAKELGVTVAELGLEESVPEEDHDSQRNS